MAAGKEKNYFDMFVVSAEFGCKASHRLGQLIRGFNTTQITLPEVEGIHETEHEADIHFHELFEQLNRSFITPIEREDILTLAQALDDVTDSIEAIAYTLYCLNFKQINGEVTKFMELIEKSCEAVKSAVAEFKRFKKSQVLAEKIIEVNRIESEGDMLYHRVLRDLFQHAGDPLDTLKYKELYEKMETCLDTCENVADILEGIALKNS